MRTEDVAVDVVIDDGVSSGRGRITVLQLAWRRADPLAVVLRLVSQPDHPALPRGRWEVLRDFLRYGLEEPTGDGDVRIRPADAGRWVCLELVYDGHPATVSVPAGTVREFLAATEQLVPAGEERSDEDLDDVIAALLRT